MVGHLFILFVEENGLILQVVSPKLWAGIKADYTVRFLFDKNVL